MPGDADVSLTERPARPRGRPRQLSEVERRHRLFDAAERVFLESGYGAATMDDVANRAGMSKKTLYEVFTTKEALFTALIADRIDTMITPAEKDWGKRPPADVLRSVLRQFALFVLSPRQMAMSRLMAAEGERYPELAQAFHRVSPGCGKAALVRWLTLQRDHGRLRLADPEEAAGMLFGMAIGEPHMKLMLGLKRRPSKAVLERRIKRAVDIFLKGTATR